MVKLTQVDDATANDFTASEKQTFAHSAGSDSEISDSDSDIEDDFDLENETLVDRLVALKDIIPPQNRTQILNASEVAKSYVISALHRSGNLLWGLTSSALLLGVPLSLAILAETQLQEMEKEMSLQQSAQDVLAPGSESAFGDEKKVATA